MKRMVLVLALFLLFAPKADASNFVVEADANSISPIYYQNITPPYSAAPLNTGLFFNSGDLLEISASGAWSNAPLYYNLVFGPDGNPGENIAPTYPGAGYPVAALMGKIGDGDYFLIGSSFSDYVSESGVLYLGHNDTDYGNNWNSISVDVNAPSATIPEPASLALLGFGLMGVGVFKRRKRA